MGVNALEKIAPAIALGLKNRWNNGHETTEHIDMREYDSGRQISAEQGSGLITRGRSVALSEKTGFVEASIGRMVPSAANADSGNPLEITVEEYEELPVDRDGFKGEIPDIKNMIAFSPFDFYIKRKIYVHNMGHT